MAASESNGVILSTRILPVGTGDLGKFKDPKTLEHWELPADPAILEPLKEAAEILKTGDIPVGFPTETVYGLGADATRSEAVKGIYKAKGRPSDNPLIIHVSDLNMLREFVPSTESIPEIYLPLIRSFWPGPLTILLSNPSPSKLAPEVTAGLPTFGVRMPSSPLALSLIHLTGRPLAAPSANASTKPSPTTAAHVQHDLSGRIELILDGGACQVGVESTVVDGLCNPPVVLRPGGVSIERIRECKGWEGVTRAYRDQSQVGDGAPRAPGMKYKHYSPKARVVLFEAASTSGVMEAPSGIPGEVREIIAGVSKKLAYLDYTTLDRPARIGIVSTKHWSTWAGFDSSPLADLYGEEKVVTTDSYSMKKGELWSKKVNHIADLISISLGTATKDIAHGLFSALRELDQRGVDVIYVEGINDEGDIAAAVMNRLRKAASVIKKYRQ